MVSTRTKEALLRLFTAAAVAAVAAGAGGRALAQPAAPKHIASLTTKDGYLYVDVGTPNACDSPSSSSSRNRFFLKIDGKPFTQVQASMLLTARAQNLRIRISGGGLGSCDAEHGEELNYLEIQSDDQSGDR